MKAQAQSEISISFGVPSNRQLWLTFSMEETMKQLNTQPFQRSKKTIMKKVWLLLVIMLIVLFSACTQQPVPEQTIESQGINTWSFPQETVVSGVSAYPNSAVLAVTTDSNNNPVLAHKNTNSGLSVKRWLNSSWQTMGGQLNATNTEVSGFSGAAIAKNGNTPIVAYSEQTATTYKIYVKRWNGSSWTSYGAGAALNINAAKYAYKPSLAVDSAGNPVVAWTENVDSLTTKVFVKRWNGSSWDTLGSSGLFHASQAQLAVGDDGKPVLAYLKCVSGDDFNCTNQDLYVVRWEFFSSNLLAGYIWKTLGQTLESSASLSPSNPRLAVYNNEPVVAWLESSGHVIVKRRGQICLQNVCSPTWLNLGKGFGYAGAFSMEVNSAGEPIIAYITCDNPEFCPSYNAGVVRVVSSGNWPSVGSKLDTVATNDVRKPVLSVTGKSYTVAWLEFGSGNASYSDIKLKQYTTLNLQPF